MTPHPLTSEVSKRLGFSFNTNLANNLTYLRNAVMHQDFDCTILIDGGEGGGKSVFGMQVAHFLDRDNSIDIHKQLCWTPEQFKRAVRSLPKFKAIVWDEARRGLNRRRSVKNVNLEITDLLAECRQRNLFLIVIMPSFYDMDMNVAVWRSRALIHVWYTIDAKNPDKPLTRGFFRFYTEEGKKRLYTDKLLRQGYRYPYVPDESFDATFTHHYVVDEAEYRRLKADSIANKPSAEDAQQILYYKRQSCIALYDHLRKLDLWAYGATSELQKYLGFESQKSFNDYRTGIEHSDKGEKARESETYDVEENKEGS